MHSYWCQFVFNYFLIKNYWLVKKKFKLFSVSFLKYSMKCSQKASSIVWKQCLYISVFGCILNRNFGRNRKLEPNRNRNSYRNRNFGQNRNRNRKFLITSWNIIYLPPIFWVSLHFNKNHIFDKPFNKKSTYNLINH